jgi:hypothetical protein
MSLVSVAKIDGNADDLQHYTVFYNGVVQLNKDVTWCTFFTTRELGTKEPGCHDGRKGDNVTISAIANFEKRELGWALMCTASYTTAGTDECSFRTTFAFLSPALPSGIFIWVSFNAAAAALAEFSLVPLRFRF